MTSGETRGLRLRFGHGVVAAAVLLGLVVWGASGLRDRAGARAAFPLSQGRLEVVGIEGRVEILRDGRGVPHVFADSEADVFFGLGFAHAQDRLGQMVWLSRSAQGRSAEIVGVEGVPADRMARVLGLARAAEMQLETLDDATRVVLEAYARGVNARIARIEQGRVAAPLSLAGVALEPWTPVDSLAVFKLYAWGTSGALDASLVLADLIEHLGGFQARRFFPQPSGGDAVPVPAAPPSVAEHPGAGPDPLRRAVGMEGRTIGSSAWVLAGSHTASGAPILAADAHLEPTAPPLMHLDHIRGADVDVLGVTLPGVPVFWTGRNSRVAWASTQARASTSDLYAETLSRQDPERYHDGWGWRDLAVHDEVIEVRGAPDVTLRVRVSRHGPLINDALEEEREPLALAWVGTRMPEARGIASLLDVARAKDAAGVREALRGHDEPALVMIFADEDGAGGRQVAGWIPERPIPTGLVPLPGRASYYDWRGPIDFESLPSSELVGGRGWLIAADNRLRGAVDAPRIEWLWRSGARAQRVEHLLRQQSRRGPVDVRVMTALQADEGGARSPRVIAHALRLAGDEASLSAEAREIAALLRGWDGASGAESSGAAAYHVFLESLSHRLLAADLGDSLLQRYLALPQVDPDGIVLGILASAASGKGEPPIGTAAVTVAQQVRESLGEAWLRLSYELGASRDKWRWGRLHALRFRTYGAHRRNHDAALGPFPYGGSSDSPNAAEYDPGDPFDVRVVSVVRFAVDTSALDQPLVSFAPGQSEHPTHPHYSDGLVQWMSGRAGLLPTTRLMVEESSTAKLELVPAR
jgi:penicillin amidase